MVKQVFRVEGLKELEATMMKLPGALNKRVVTALLMDTAKPLATDASMLAPDDPKTGGFDLHTTVRAGTQTTRRTRVPKQSPVEVYIGPRSRHQHLMEFGTENTPAQPFMRPMWDGGQQWALNNIKVELWGRIEGAAKRYAKRMAKRG